MSTIRELSEKLLGEEEEDDSTDDKSLCRWQEFANNASMETGKNDDEATNVQNKNQSLPIFLVTIICMISVMLTFLSLASCRFFVINWIEATFVIKYVGFYNYLNPQTNTCWEYEVTTDDPFFPRDQTARNLIIIGSTLATLSFFVLFARWIMSFFNQSCTSSTSTCCKFFKRITPLFLLGSAICQTLALLTLIRQNESIVCNNEYSSCALGEGGIMSIVSSIIYVFLALALPLRIDPLV